MSDASGVAVIGAGPAGLMAADVIASAGHRVTVYDAMPSAGRKFLMAGRGGLNLTHSEPLPQFLARYSDACDWLTPAIQGFSPEALRAFSQTLGETTFVGSSGRVFPRSFKASPLLRAWLKRLDAMGVAFAFRHRWTGFDRGALTFAVSDTTYRIEPRATMLALGGASWRRLGSDGAWAMLLRNEGVRVVPFQPSNCGFDIAWSDHLRERFAGSPLKTIAISHDGVTMRGEAVITRDGIEGGAIYALSARLREAIMHDGSAILHVDLRPNLTSERLAEKFAASSRKQSLSTRLRKAFSLSPVAIALIQEVARRDDIQLASLEPGAMATRVKAVRIALTGIAPIDRAISTAGGIARDEIDPTFMLRKVPGVFVAGEMIDWDAPTGGYLLQAAFSTGAAAGQCVVRFLEDTEQ